MAAVLAPRDHAAAPAPSSTPSEMPRAAPRTSKRTSGRMGRTSSGGRRGRS